MGRFHRESQEVIKFHQSELYQRLQKFDQDESDNALNFQKDLSSFLVFLANVFDAYKTFAERIDDQTYNSRVADDADDLFLKINSAISAVLKFNHSQSFPLFDADVKLLDESADYALRYWHQADMIETLYRNFYQELFGVLPNADDAIANVVQTQKINR